MTQKFKKNIGSQMGQELAERAFATYEKFKYGKAKKYILKVMKISILLEKKVILQDLDFLKKIVAYLG